MKSQVIGVTGGIGSGKSALCDYFAQLGYPVIDTDQIAKDIVKPNQPGLVALIKQLGSDYLQSNGELDRAKLRDTFFQDPLIKQQVEATLHPLVRQTVRDQINQLRGQHALIFVAIPVIHQLNQPEYQLNRVLLVEAEENQQLERVKNRDQRSPEQIKVIMQQQATPQQRRALADDVIENKAGLDDLHNQADAWLKQTLNRLGPVT
ncbi:MAG: dephospho-CoA kinase [Thiomicrospira sp.]|uniref:dephospho-CoA kinase n=1 Tax=Thiomicrospira sp. TaxID=935 RepID=UPI0019F3DD06|nr:dephospho-CoA kinase [Thiomicrospira sp.]MBE0492933.1 dephospho-CoA kinase [Thiomicrospira sp.]